MSEWYQADKEDIHVNLAEKEVDILVTSNDNGNIYSILTFEQIKGIQFLIDNANKLK